MNAYVCNFDSFEFFFKALRDPFVLVEGVKTTIDCFPSQIWLIYRWIKIKDRMILLYTS